ncbi:ParB/RepB/Spo0J family partition protein [Streptomyces sp. NPDC058471]|uniref:ParB/RepB/Spo0J family partition protein n=1 Tax=Streptomyces sp. NPDC058471 TaxID=3346516 RepID=UPI00365BEAB5
MKAADRLGSGSSFGKVPRGRSDRGRAKAIAQGDVPAYELVRLHLDEVSPTPLNPRRNFGSEEQLTRFGEELRRVQLAACVVVTRDAYLALWEDHADRIGSATHVLVNGERRYRSGVHVGLDALDFVVRDDLAATREDFIENLLQENLDREDFDLVERARGVQVLVGVCGEEASTGAQSRAADRLGKSKAWVTNQLALLTLPQEIQTMLSAGSLPERDGRLLARHYKAHPDLDASLLLQHLKSVRDEEAQTKQRERSLLEAAKQQTLTAVNKEPAADEPSSDPSPAPPAALTAVNKPAPEKTDNHTRAGAKGKAQPPKAPAPLTAVNTSDSDSSQTRAPQPSGKPDVSVPHQATPEPSELVDTLPWTDPAWVDRQVRRRMDREERKKLVWLLEAEEDE